MTGFKESGAKPPTALQVQRAYLAHFGYPMQDCIAFADALAELRTAMGPRRAIMLCIAQSNDPNDPDLIP